MIGHRNRALTRQTADTQVAVVSNRLPVNVGVASDGKVAIEPSAGGLVSALRPVLQENGGRWIGWSGTSQEHETDELVQQIRTSESAYDLRPVPLQRQEISTFYDGTCNSVLWPVLHSMLHRADLTALDWPTYQEVNRRFAQEIVRARAGQVWIHDYHLFSAARHVRELLKAQDSSAHNDCPPLGFFLHIPFPQPAVLRALPVARQLLHDLLQHDLVALQTERDLRSLVRCVRELLPDLSHSLREHEGGFLLEFDSGRSCHLRALPIGIDADEYADRAASAETDLEMARLATDLGGRDLYLSVDRLDYTKGLAVRLEAIDAYLDLHPERAGLFEFHQVAVPTRTNVPAYRSYAERVRTLAADINRRWQTDVWRPVHLHEHCVPPHRLTALYRSARVLLVTPHRDGMNLVAKEYCACQSSPAPGSLVLSSGAGAAMQLRAAETVNGDRCASILDGLLRALARTPRERFTAMTALRGNVRRNDVHHWSRTFLANLAGTRSRPSRAALRAVGADAS